MVPNLAMHKWCDGCGAQLPLHQPEAPWHATTRRRITSRNMSPNDPIPRPKAHYANTRDKDSFERIMHAQLGRLETSSSGNLRTGSRIFGEIPNLVFL